MRRRVGWPMSRQASGLAASMSALVRILTASSWWWPSRCASSMTRRGTRPRSPCSAAMRAAAWAARVALPWAGRPPSAVTTWWWMLPVIQGERGGVIAGERVRDVKAPPGYAGRGLVFRVSRGCSACRGDLGDGGPGGGVVDEVLAGAGGGDQGGGADVVDGSGFSAGGLVDLGDRLVGEEVGGAACLLEVVADVAGGLVGGHALHLVADGDPLLQGYL